MSRDEFNDARFARLSLHNITYRSQQKMHLFHANHTPLEPALVMILTLEVLLLLFKGILFLQDSSQENAALLQAISVD